MRLASRNARLPMIYDLGFVSGDTCECPRCSAYVRGVDSRYLMGHPGQVRYRQVCPRCGSIMIWQADLDIMDWETGKPADIIWTTSDGQWAIIGYYPDEGTLWYDDAIGAVEVLWPYDDCVLGIFLLKDGTIKFGFHDDDESEYHPELVARARAILSAEYAKYKVVNGAVSSKRTKPKTKASTAAESGYRTTEKRRR